MRMKYRADVELNLVNLGRLSIDLAPTLKSLSVEVVLDLGDR